jgi:hypothetical protein
MSRRAVILGAALCVATIGFTGISNGATRTTATPAEDTLIGHVPPSVASTCVGATAKIKSYLKSLTPKAAPIVKKISAAVQCSPPGIDGVVHIQFTSDRALDRAYALLLAKTGVAPKTKAIAEGTCPVEAGFGKPEEGRVGCVGSGSGGRSAEVFWTTWKLRTLSDALLADDQLGTTVFKFFQGSDSGPV